MITECLLIKNENRYLLEHLKCNAAAGIDHFFIYDNLSDIPVVDFLRENAREFLNICTVVRYHSNGNLQMDCYNSHVAKHRHVDWTVFLDTDECFTGNIRDLVAEYGEQYNCFTFAPVMHGCAGHMYDNGGGMFERFGDSITNAEHHWYKCCARTSDISIIKSPHCVHLDNKRMLYVSRRTHPQCVLHHFRYRSFEEWVVKMKRGTCLPDSTHSLREFFAGCKMSTRDPRIADIMQRYGVDLDFCEPHPPKLEKF